MTTPEYRYWHNPRCSKSRDALALLQARGIQPEVVAYLDAELTTDDLRAVLDALGMAPRALLRTGEQAYRDLGLDDPAIDDDALLAAMLAQRRLIQRPILIRGNRAVIGRPPERVLDLLD